MSAQIATQIANSFNELKENWQKKMCGTEMEMRIRESLKNHASFFEEIEKLHAKKCENFAPKFNMFGFSVSSLAEAERASNSDLLNNVLAYRGTTTRSMQTAFQQLMLCEFLMRKIQGNPNATESELLESIVDDLVCETIKMKKEMDLVSLETEESRFRENLKKEMENVCNKIINESYEMARQQMRSQMVDSLLILEKEGVPQSVIDRFAELIRYHN